MKTRQEKKEQTRSNIRGSAKQLFISQGFAQTTMRQIAKEAGVALGTSFVHFKDKHAILEDILFEDIERVVGQAFVTLPKDNDALEQLLHLAKELYSYYKRNPELSRELLKNNFFNPSEENDFSKQIHDFIITISQIIKVGQEKGSINQRKDAGLTARAFMAFYLIVLTALLREEVQTVEEALDMLEQLCQTIFT